MQKQKGNCSITNAAKGKLPRLPFSAMKEAVLGKKYRLSVVVITLAKMRSLNRTYRKKDAPTDILSFPLSKTEGEIFLNLTEAGKESKKFGRPFENFIAFLFIHGLVHLKGFAHGSRMEVLERKFRNKFNV